MITLWILRRPRMPGIVRTLIFMGLAVTALIYLDGFPGGFSLFGAFALWFGEHFEAVWLIPLFLLVIGSIALERIEWQGPILLRRGEGEAWSRSIRARLGMLGFLPFWAIAVMSLFEFAQRAAYAADWGRTAVAAFCCLDVALIILSSLARALSLRPVLSIGPEGVRIGGYLVPLGAVRRLKVRGDLRERQVALVVADGDRWVNLDDAGLTARTFVDRLLALAPELPVDWPVRGEAAV